MSRRSRAKPSPCLPAYCSLPKLKLSPTWAYEFRPTKTRLSWCKRDLEDGPLMTEVFEMLAISTVRG